STASETMRKSTKIVTTVYKENALEILHTLTKIAARHRKIVKDIFI
ncbi:MAG: hypothetical protein ACI94Y_001839, partial [Maribacter sp.]